MKPACIIAAQTLEIAKGITTKREKIDGVELLVSRLKFSKLAVSREQCDNLVGRQEGWAQAAFFDAFGAPTMRAVLSLTDRVLSLSGTISGKAADEGDDDEDRDGELFDSSSKPEAYRFKLTLLQAQLYDIEIRFTPHGAHVSGAIAWKAAGDEVENVEDLLGRVCLATWELHDGAQLSLLEGEKVEANERRLSEVDGTPAAQVIDDVLYSSARIHVLQTGKVSIPAVQRELKIGYNRAARLIESMEAEGLVGPLMPDGTRRVMAQAAH